MCYRSFSTKVVRQVRPRFPNPPRGVAWVLSLIGQGGKFNGISTKSGTNYLAVRAPTIPLISLVKSSVYPILRSLDDFL